MSKKSNIEYSKFWLGRDFDLEKEFDKNNTIDLLRLAAYRRAIANFVFILTGKNIPVRFSEKSGRSMTDGKVVYIGGDLSHGHFDVTVGLSLHEASHIVKSDFALIKTIWGKIPRKLYDAAGEKIAKNTLADFVKYILNVIEDRYIDAWAYESAPGYRGYYVALYDRYFNLPKISTALQSQAFRKANLKSYRFRITNMTNPHRDMDALPGLKEIDDLIDIKNILRLDTPQKRMDLAIDVCEIIVKNIIKEDENKDKTEKQSGNDESESQEKEDSESEESNGSNEKENTEENNEQTEKVEEQQEESDEEEECSKEEKQKELAGETENNSGDLNEKQVADLEKIIKKQEEIVSREITQKSFDEETIKKLDLLEKSGVDLVPVGDDMGIPAIGCIVVRNMTKELMLSDDFPYTNKMVMNQINLDSQRGVEEGVVLGTMLGRRLQVRGEAKVTKFNRLQKGKFDKRMIADLGFDGENVFYQTQVDKYKNVHLHLTVDASSSMSSKWRRTMKTLVAVAKAGSMVNNLQVVISFRSGASLSRANVFEMNELPYVVIAYDSRKDKFSKITQLFPMLYPYGSTPEGLAFEAIAENIPASSLDVDSYFLNLSDGEPAFGRNYFGDVAANHTKKQVNKIRERGIEVLSYFIEQQGVMNYRIDNNTKAFKNMYGKDAQIIDVDNVTQIAHTLNKKFLVYEK